MMAPFEPGVPYIALPFLAECLGWTYRKRVVWVSCFEFWDSMLFQLLFLLLSTSG